MADDKYWVVFTDGIPASFKKHTNSADAEKEAIEVAIETKRKATVLESVCFFLQPPAPQPERFDMKPVIKAEDAVQAQMS